MKSFIIIFSLLTFMSVHELSAQKKIKERDLIGTWKLIINIEEGFKEAKEELKEEENNLIGSIILGSVEGLVTSILDEVDIYMDFQKGGELKIIVEAFDEKEVEYSKWQIDEKGQLIIEESENTDVDYWILEDGLLVGYDDNGGKNFAYMVKIK